MASHEYVSGGEKISPVASSPEPYEVGQTYNSPKRRFHFSLAVDQEPSSFARTPAASNADFDPVPPSKRTWGSAAFFAYWMADGWAVSNWQVGESIRVAQLDSCECAVTDLVPSVLHDRKWPQLEIGYRCSCTRQRYYGRRDHDQRKNWCQSEY
jgi:hypothetical protein